MTDLPDNVAARRAALLDRIAARCKAQGRDPSMVTLTAVSKRQPDERIDEALSCGQRIFGENRVQEAQKHWISRRAHHPDLELRLIGPLQSNKAEDAVALFDVIEVLDREKLARELRKAMDQLGRSPELFVQVNTGEEKQKAGIAPADVDDFLARIREAHGLQPVGLMCIPPVNEPAGPHFALLAKIAARNRLTKLSMGMSADFETAIDFGATHVRVGSAFFGERETD
jgi:PLP dependent protein